MFIYFSLSYYVYIWVKFLYRALRINIIISDLDAYKLIFIIVATILFIIILFIFFVLDKNLAL
jgi:hypothetical protein